MNNPKAIHETFVKDIIDTITHGVSNGISKLGTKKNVGIQHSTSIARATAGMTLVFPVICSKSVSIGSASMITKAIERRSVTTLRLAFSAYNITNATDALSYIKQFHTNLNTDTMSVDSFIDTMETLTEGVEIPFINNTEVIKFIKEDARVNLDHFFDDDINESSINSFKFINRLGNDIIIKEADSPDDNIPFSYKDIDDVYANDKDKSNAYKMKYDKYKDDRQYDYKKGSDDARNNMEKLKSDRLNDKTNRDYEADKFKTNLNMIQNQLIPSDVKKANELVPTMIAINFYAYDDKNLNVERQAVVGVKAKLYDVEPNEVLSRLVTKNADSNFMLKLVKASTREISFIKDLLFAIDGAKLDALSKSKRGSATKLFKALERRSLKGKIRKAAKSAIDAKAISTLVISQEEAEQLRKYNNIDVEKASIIIPIMEKLNLLYFVIIDESVEVIKILCDGDSNYETLTFDGLERDSNDNAYKKAINLITKVNK